VLSPSKWEIAKFFMSGAQFNLFFGYLCQDEPLGMPGALDTAYSWIKDCTVCMGMPDTIVEPADCFEQLLRFHREKEADLSLGIFPTPNPETLAPVHIDPTSARVIEIFDKPLRPPHFNTWGIAIWGPSFTELLHCYVQQRTELRAGQELILSSVFTEALVHGLKVYGKWFPQGKFYDIGTPEGLKSARMAIEYANSTVP
jgi:glucose-1-phosphate thymidylyltransferase